MAVQVAEAKVERLSPPIKEESTPDHSPASVIKKGEFSGYNAEVGQTDSNPFTMANGKKVFDGAIANNCLPFGTKVEVNNKTYFVSDRMNKRYGCDHFDIFFWDKTEAIKFGRKTLDYKVIN